MTRLLVHSAPPCPNVIRASTVFVYVDGQRRRDLHAESWTSGPAPRFGRAEFTLASAARGILGMGEQAAFPAIGSRIQISLLPALRYVVFDGFVTKHRLGIGPDAEQLGIGAEDVLAARLGVPVVGRWEVSEGSPVHVPIGKCVFNANPDGLASSDGHPLGNAVVRVFDSSGDGQPWSVADILRYLLAAHVGGEVEVAGLEELDAGANGIFPARVSLTGLSAAQALARVCGLAALAVRGSALRDGGGAPALVFYRPGRTGPRRTVRLQPAGQVLDSRRTDLWAGRVEIRRRPARRGILALGSHKVYESTFELQPCWNPYLATYHHRDFVRSESADWPAMADVFRKWVLNEGGQYSDEPHELQPFDLATVSADDFLLRRPRGLLPCLSRDAAGRSLGIVVEVSCDDGVTWRRHGGPVVADDDECTVFLSEDSLGADYFQAALAGEAKVRVTAAVASDRRLSVETPGDPGGGVELVEAADARWARVHTGSIFHQSEDLPAPDERDDTSKLERLAETLRVSPAGALEGEFSLGRLRPLFGVGDIIERIDGRRLELATFPGAAPHVERVEHHCGEEWFTKLIVTG